MWKRLLIVIAVISAFFTVLTMLIGINFFGLVIILIPFCLISFAFMMAGLIATVITIFVPLVALVNIPDYIKNGGNIELFWSFLYGAVVWVCSLLYLIVGTIVSNSVWYNSFFDGLIDFCL